MANGGPQLLLESLVFGLLASFGETVKAVGLTPLTVEMTSIATDRGPDSCERGS